MVVIKAAADVARIDALEIGILIETRIAALSEDEPYDANIHGYFVLWEQGDSIEDFDRLLGFALLSNRFTGLRFGESGFSPGFELVEEHLTCFEMVFVLSDDGYGVVVFIPKTANADPSLLAMCRQYAIPVQEPTSP
ncbi:MAG: hypothetical protein Q7K57_47700 [Burkholderiaceae bacterium]|nr:hypothetical protein [Burkholderiaceae bacterium]